MGKDKFIEVYMSVLLIALLITVIGMLLSYKAEAQPTGYIPDYNYLHATDEYFCEEVTPVVYAYVAYHPEEAVGIYNAIAPYYDRMGDKEKRRSEWLVAVLQSAYKFSTTYKAFTTQEEIDFRNQVVDVCFEQTSEGV